MTWLFPRLKKRIQIRRVEDLHPNDDGGFDRDLYTTLLTVWAKCKPLKPGSYIRGIQTDEQITHEFEIRRVAVSTLGGEFSTAFDESFTAFSSLALLKSDYFIFLQEGSTSIGRLFKIHNIKDHNELKEFLVIQAEEIEEVSTGYAQ